MCPLSTNIYKFLNLQIFAIKIVQNTFTFIDFYKNIFYGLLRVIYHETEIKKKTFSKNSNFAETVFLK